MRITVFIALISCGTWLLYLERKFLRLGLASYKWPKTDGKIVGSKDSSFTIDGLTQNFGTSSVQFLQRAHVYEYTVKSHIYQCSTYCFGGWIDSALEFYSIGAKVKVHYDPHHPEVAVLKPGLRLGALFGLFFIAAAFIWEAFAVLILR